MVVNANTAYATRMLAASTCLTEPGHSIFERLFLQGEKESNVMADLRLSLDEFAKAKTNMLRSLMIASQ